MQAMTLNEAVKNLSDIMDQVNDAHEPLVMTHENHKPVVIMSLEDFNAWQETAYLTRSSANTKDLLDAVEEIRIHTKI